MAVMGKCALCLKRRKLRRSHIIPEFTYRAIKGEEDRFYTFEPLTGEKTGTRQTGVWSYLLCDECERFLNDQFEKPFLKYWLEGNALAAVEGKRSAKLTGIDYGPFKLFHLSVLFRASATDRHEFDAVDLGDQQDEIRQMILREEPGLAWKYPIICSAIEGEAGEVMDDFVGAASILVRGHRGYLFTFCGCQWIYVVSRIADPKLEEIALTERGELPIVKREWAILQHSRQQLHDERKE